MGGTKENITRRGLGFMNTHILFSCLTIFCCRIIDVSLGTIRTVLTVKERTLASALIGFLEVFIWYLVVRDALNGDAPALLTAISYAGGYATGTFVGGKIAGALVGGDVTMEVVTSKRDPEVLAYLRSFGYGLTVLNVEAGRDGVPKYLILSTIDKKQVHIFRENIQKVDPKAMIMIQSTLSRVGGYDRAKILSNDDYQKAYKMYLERRKKSVFGLEKDLIAAYGENFQLTKAEALKILLAVRDDRIAEEKNKRAARAAAASMPPRKGK